MAFLEVVLLLSAIVTLIYLWCRHQYAYWERKGIAFDKPTFFIGNIKEVLQKKQSFTLQLSYIYSKPEFAKEPVIGIFNMMRPALIIKDMDLAKSILIKDFNQFSDRYATVDPHTDKLTSYNLFFVKNPMWKEIRTKLTPVFTSGKIKQMYPLMQEVGLNLEKQLEKQSKGSNKFQCELKEITALFTTDLIATVAFGIKANSLEHPNGEFREQGRKVLNFTPLRAFATLAVFFMPKLASLLRFQIFTKEYSAFIRRSISYAMSERESSGKTRNDLIDILVALKKEAAADKSGKHIAKDLDYLVAQASLFFSAGYETSAATLAFSLYELAKHPELQKRLREEIKEALREEKSNNLSYERISSMEYLNMVVAETSRLYPIMPIIDRVYKSIPGEEKFSLRPHYDFELEDGTPVYMPSYAIHRDPKYWPNPDEFDPERFSTENKKTHHPVAYLPFGAGPHNCIGMRVGLLQVKLGLVHYLKNYFVSTCPETVEEVKYNPLHLTLQCNEDLILELNKDILY